MHRLIKRIARRVEDAAGSLVVRQAGGIVFRLDKRGAVRILLVTARRDRGRWVLPKGTIKRRESAAEAALREVREESGVRGKIIGPAGTARHGNSRGLVRIDYFLIAFRSAEKSASEARKVEWRSIDDAIEMLSRASARRILANARPALKEAAKKANNGRTK
jgi:8-oxo-dGTP pyrophosphatase MutT (NUDIX family)